MILNKKPLCLAEVKTVAKDIEENKVLADYLRAFCKTTPEKAEALKKDFLGLNNMKMKEELAIKIIDLLPEDPEEVNKIFVENSLNEEETQEILALVKKH